LIFSFLPVIKAYVDGSVDEAGFKDCSTEPDVLYTPATVPCKEITGEIVSVKLRTMQYRW
jgi:hypothetical protein